MDAAVAETHAGVVFFVGDRAYKLKKALDLGFVDFRRREDRLTACRNEVALNRRIAPDVYLGVADVVDEEGRPCEHLVVMRRMPPERRLAALVTGGEPVGAELAGLARLLAAFHRDCARSEAVDEAARAEAQLARWEANGAEMERFVGDVLDGGEAEAVITRARRYVAGRGPLFDARIAAGRACDGHGDLLADDIFCLEDGPRVLDCLEFDERLRFGDVLADVAFLAMDLERLGRPDLATAFLDSYREEAGDDWPASLAHHHVAYRAQVRGKVACLRWSQGDEPSREAARRLFGLCLDHLEAGRVRLVVVGGGPGTGKSTVARALGADLGAVVLRSDQVRKELAGLDPGRAAPAALDEGLYRPASTAATYEALLEQARALVEGGETVVLDASWRDPDWRERVAALARGTSSDLVELRCDAPLEVALARVATRAGAGGDPSDATPDVVRAMAGAFSGWDTATVLDTTGELDTTVAAARRAVDRSDGVGGNPPLDGGAPLGP